jgi:hypothetical protein
MTPNRMLLNVYSISLKKRKENMQKKKQLKHLNFYFLFIFERQIKRNTSKNDIDQ